MQTVSDAYKTGMKAPLRNQGYISVSFGFYDEHVQRWARISSAASDFTYYSSSRKVFLPGVDPSEPEYATLEENFTKVDGSMKFLPRQDSRYSPRNIGLVSNDLVSDGPVTIEVDLQYVRSWYGLTIEFTDQYPVDFDIIAANETVSIRGNNSSVCRIDQGFNDTDFVRIVAINMKNEHTRVRIRRIYFGIGLTYENEDVLNSSLTRIVSPISEFIPQYDFTVTLKNENQYFNLDNPKSAVNFLATGQEVSVMYGYELDDGEVEWVPGQQLRCESWEADRFTATIRCVDVLRHMDEEYLGGTYNTNGKTFYILASEVLASARVSDYYLDPVLRTLTTKLPMPRVTHKEALQLIANACRCVLQISRTGRVEIVQRNDNLVDFRMEHQDMLSYPLAKKLSSVKDVVVNYQLWFPGDEGQEIIYSETRSVVAGEEETIYFTDPAHNFRLRLDNGYYPSAIIASGDYYVTVRYPRSGSNTKIEVIGTRYKIVRHKSKQNINPVGETIEWNNPLIDGIENAYYLAQWLAEYYADEIEYEYDTRGNPELDIADLIYQDNEFKKYMRVRITDYTLNFKQSFSGSVVTRRKGGV